MNELRPCIRTLAFIGFAFCGVAACDESSDPVEHRASDAACSAPPSPGDCTPNTFDGCHSDSECVDGLNGRCVYPGGGAASGCGCTYDVCSRDADCADDETCACHGSSKLLGAVGNHCVPSNCRADVECGRNGFSDYCSPTATDGICGDSLAGYYCHTAADQCGSDSDCSVPDSVAGIAVCGFSKTHARWQCASPPICL